MIMKDAGINTKLSLLKTLPQKRILNYYSVVYAFTEH